MEEMDEYDAAPWWIQTQERSYWLEQLRSQKPWKFHRTGVLAVFHPHAPSTRVGEDFGRDCARGVDEKLDGSNALSSRGEVESIFEDDDEKIALDAKNEFLQTTAGSLILPTQTLTKNGPGHVKFPPRELCAHCRRGFEGALFKQSQPLSEEGEFFDSDHHSSFERISASAADGCALCQMFLKGYISQGTHDQSQRREMRFSIPRITRSAIEDGMLISDLEYGTPKSEDPSHEFSVLLEGQSKFHQRKTAIFPDLELGRQWMQTCIRDHDCDETRTSELPTRLIDVGGSTTEAKLVDTNTIGEKQACYYTALSHCWGSRHPNARTTKKNVRTRTTSMDLSSLEQTFQDAITVTRALGYQYSWIDTLCIIQDDESDWQRECSRMDTVFSNAAVTIAALDAPDAFAGFLQPRKLQGTHDVSCQVSLVTHSGWDEKMLVSQRDAFAQQEKKIREWSCLLGQRAWCLQKQVLSTRTLNFSQFQMSFECRKCQWHEIPLWPRSSSELITGLNSHRNHYLPRTTSLPQAPISDLHLVHFHWVVREYSCRNLSFRKDRLPALSGLVKRFHKSQPDEYLAGLWRRDLCRELGWSGLKQDPHYCNGEMDHASSEYVAPSWFWASIDRGAKFMEGDGFHFEPAVDIVSAYTTLVGNDPYGQVSAGEIRMRAWVIEHLFYFRALHCALDLSREAKGPPFAQISFDRCEDEPKADQQLILTCLLLGKGDSMSTGLMLQPVDWCSSRYRRIGAMASYWEPQSQKRFEDLIKKGEYKEARLI